MLFLQPDGMTKYNSLIQYTLSTVSRLCIPVNSSYIFFPDHSTTIYNFLIQVAAESVPIFAAINDGNFRLVDKVRINFDLLFQEHIKCLIHLEKDSLICILWQFFEMQRQEAVRALEIYRKATAQVTYFLHVVYAC